MVSPASLLDIAKAAAVRQPVASIETASDADAAWTCLFAPQDAFSFRKRSRS